MEHSLIIERLSKRISVSQAGPSRCCTRDLLPRENDPGTLFAYAKLDSIRNQNTQEVKNERFLLISTRQNNCAFVLSSRC